MDHALLDEGLNLSPTLGPLYWGFLLSLVLTGINVLQGYIYFPSNDKPSIQIVAACMLLLNIASSALVAQSVYYYLVPHFGSLLPLASITTELSAECLISTTITLISQVYFVVPLYRVVKLRKQSSLIPIAVAVLAILAFVFGAACTTLMVVHKHSVLSNRNGTFSVFFGLAKGFGAITDIFASVSMCLLFASANTKMSGTNSVLERLIHYVMQRGVLVTVIQSLLLISFHAAPGHVYWLAFHVNVTKLYANTFFAMLNGRDQEHLGNNSVSIGSSSRQWWDTSRTSRSATNPAMLADGFEMSASTHETPNKRYAFVGDPMPTVTKTVIIKEL